MASLLQSLSLAINLSHNDPALVAHLQPWTDYAWEQQSIRSCDDVVKGCRLPSQKWDWHRDQWVDFSYKLAGENLIVDLKLRDGDLSDDDYVCVTAAFLNKQDVAMFVFHQNWGIKHGEALERRYSIPLRGRWSQVASVALGTKQCRDGATQDADIYQRVLKRLGQPAETALAAVLQ